MCFNHYTVTVAAADKLTSFFLFLGCDIYFHVPFPSFFLCLLSSSCPVRFRFITFLVNTVLNQKNIISKNEKVYLLAIFYKGLNPLSTLVSLSQHGRHTVVTEQSKSPYGNQKMEGLGERVSLDHLQKHLY